MANRYLDKYGLEYYHNLIKNGLVEYITGTQNAATNAWTGVTTSPALFAGKVIIYHLPYAGTGTAATLNLTLPGGSTTGAKAVQNESGAITTQYGAGSEILMVYTGVMWRSLSVDKSILTYVTPEMYGAKGDGVTDDTTAIQKALNSGLPVSFLPKTYIVSKQIDAVNYPNGDAPCLAIINKQDLKIDGNGATLKVNVHGQGILEILESNNIIVENLNLEGYGSFPAISSPSGRGEKGTATGGYYKSGYNWDEHKNNSVNTSAYTGIDGNTSAVWGTFGGGYICNVAIGLLIEKGCSNITIRGCSSTGFNYNGFSVGFKGHTAYAYNTDILFTDCRATNIYDSGFNMLLADGVTVENSFIENIGHPSCRPVNETTAFAYTYADPGYGICCRQPSSAAYRAKHIKVLNNTISKCVRKGVDSHSVDGYTIKNNQISLCYVAGVEMSADPSEATLSYDCIIDSNILEYCGYKGNAISQQIYTGDESFNPDDYEINTIISNNILRNCSGDVRGIIFTRIGKNTSIINNVISDEWALGTLNGAVILAGQAEKTSSNIRISGNNISMPGSTVPFPLYTYNLINSIVSNNMLNIDACNVVLYVRGGISCGVDVYGNNLYSGSIQAAPVIAPANTGKVFGNTMTGSTRGYKAISQKYAIASGYFAVTDAAITTNSILIITQAYSSSALMDLVFTAQARNGAANIYVRKGDGTLPADGDVDVNILIINNQ